MCVHAFSQIVDTSLSYNDLGMLGAKLKLPSGWRYSSMSIEKIWF